jgi:transposase
MRKIRELLRLRADGRSVRQMAASLGVPRSTVADYLGRIEAAGLAWPVPEDVDEETVLRQLFGEVGARRGRRPLPDWAEVHAQRKGPGVTLALLWLEYKQDHPDGYQYTQFCEHYHRWRKQLDPVLRQVHKAGERAFVDYAGQTMPVVDPATGEIRQAQIFVGTLGASHYIYTEATWTQRLPDWIGSHVRMYENFGGVPTLTVPDNLKTGVQHACYYEPDLNPTYHDLAIHYGTVVLPTRVAKPRDKAKAETGVQLVERWCLAPLRNHTFFGLTELNRALKLKRDALNARPFQKLPGTRRQLLDTLERPALKPLPAVPFAYYESRKARVNIDYHIQVDGHLYSVPYTLVRQEVDVRLAARTVEIIYRGKRVAAHVRSAAKGRFSTDPGHRPKAHQRHLEWTPSRLVNWGSSIGPKVGRLVQQILESKPHPEQGYRACLGLIRLARRYGTDRLEAAADRALHCRTTSYRSVKSILEHDLDRLAPEDTAVSLTLPADHAHVRGPAYYATVTAPEETENDAAPTDHRPTA